MQASCAVAAISILALRMSNPPQFRVSITRPLYVSSRALVPLVTAGDTAPRLQDLSLRNVNVRVLVDGKKRAEAFGEMLFTHFGVSGPIVLSVSRQVVDALSAGRRVTL